MREGSDLTTREERELFTRVFFLPISGLWRKKLGCVYFESRRCGSCRNELDYFTDKLSNTNYDQVVYWQPQRTGLRNQELAEGQSVAFETEHVEGVGVCLLAAVQ